MIETASGLGRGVGSADVDVMRAKLKGDTGTLQLLASRGSFAALAALKEITDASRAAAAIRSNADMQSPEVSTVLSQLGGHQVNNTQGLMHGQPQAFAQAPKVGQGFAKGGRAFSGGGMDSMPRNTESNYPDIGKLLEWLGTKASMTLRTPIPGSKEAKDAEDLASLTPAPRPQSGIAAGYNPNASPSSRAPAPQQPAAAAQQTLAPRAAQAPVQRAPVATKTVAPAVAPAPTGIAAAAGPEEDAELSPQDENMLHQAARKKLEDQASDLTSQKLKNAKENFEGATQRAGKKEDIWDFIANVARNNGSSAVGSLAAAGLATHDSKKAREEKLAGLQVAYGQQEMLIKEADLKRRMGDMDGANEAAMKAAELGRKIAASEALMDHYKALDKEANRKNTEAERLKEQDQKNKAAAATAKAAGRGGAGGAGKPMTLDKAITAAEREIARVSAANAKNPMADPTPLPDKDALVRKFMDPTYGRGAPTIAPNAAPSAKPGVKFLGFE